MKSPRQLRSDILELRTAAEVIRNTLLDKVRDPREPAWGIGRDCVKTADALNLVLTTQVVPEHYKVAVVGRFKAGKSAFVNELLGAKLAGEDTSPETAAVTTFVHGPTVRAKIRFVGSEFWEGLKRLHAEDPNHIDAHRMKMWSSFDGKARKSADGAVVEAFDLVELEKTYVRPGGHVFEIPLEKAGDRASENAFRRRLKEFTSGTRPHHCLVEEIEITSPSRLLEEGVLLIDTPGLDDTERFRVTLTEKAVEDVDAVLFLTQSGVAYGQSEKDFMLTLLRRGTVKQLIFVVTQVDKTYEQHLSAAEDNDENPETLCERISREERRIREEIDATLTELCSDDSPAMARYREQLGVVGLVFTSARKHRDWKDGKAVEHGIHANDPGGIEGMKSQLLHLLSTESRLALIAHNIAIGTKSALDELLGVIENRRAALRDIKDGEVAEQRLATFRAEFESARQEFQTAAEAEVENLRKNLADSEKKNVYFIETIGLIADRELGAFELSDVGKHWRTRRSGYWGYMHDLQSKVANRIFPRVQQLLSDMTAHFSVFVDHFEKHLSALSATSSEVAAKLEIGQVLPLDLAKTLSGSLAKSLGAANELIAAEEQRIIALLDDFVSEEVSDKISSARAKVSDIFGRGTTYYQSGEVRAFYAHVRALLQDAITTHLRARASAFGDYLVVEANGVPRNALAEVDATLTAAEHDIKAAATAHVSGERESFEQDCTAIVASLQPLLHQCTQLIEPQGAVSVPNEERVGLAPRKMPFVAPSDGLRKGDEREGRWFERIQSDATEALKRLTLKDGDSNWPFERIFDKALLAGCTKVALIDPYLAMPHQVRNLKEFVLVVAECAKPKELLVVTSSNWTEGNGVNVRIMKDVGNDLFRSFGTNLAIVVDPTIHDRYVVFDHGLLFKLGRGLDIYKPATGLASHRQGSRKVRRTDIDIFAVTGFMNRQTT